MHIFLTGEIQVGKSTVIDKTLEQLNIRYGGFKTYFGPERGSPDRILYMNSANKPIIFSEENSVVCFKDGCLPRVSTERFDTYGVELIRLARAKANLILMDECGNFERCAFEFQKEIIETLNGNQPVFGVIKLAGKGWTDLLRNHKKVRLITVTRENRDELPKLLAYDLADWIK
ncbi:MAG: nucleoside-triphosphatase [Acetobacterium sp.]